MILFITLGLVALGAGIAAVSLRNLVHCALSMTVAFAAIAGIYLQLRAEFLGFAQVLIYLGAVAILVVFAILLTRGIEAPNQPLLTRGRIAGMAVAAALFVFMAVAILSSDTPRSQAPDLRPPTVRQVGDQLMSTYVLPLEAVGLLLTSALIGAVILAESRRKDP